ncbi:dTDP-glucose 4,6-dehydratase [Limosilactobacillus mucosae]|uniref:dTDP-glucose 4,6-dehydratase n=1 Tax=Limosilactobacillus mucosae TaxID=97478 RepID=UPI00233EC802|nr:dTDP-glucose 4,6-dehydratase [Limosilactobacillus mucosae]MDC2844898.1 dTDP-glucose 4,6-dehydratase [Limosilactobacillus mucosae]
MRLLVTGGAGFIGSHFIDYELANDQNVEIINLDALTYAGNTVNNALAAGNAHYHFVHGSINNRELIDWLLKEFEIDHIVNFAAESHVDRSLKDPELFTKTNVLGTQVLLDAAYQANIQKFIQISTDEVYGTMPPGQSAKEDDPLHPSSPYAASKASADLLALAMVHTFGMPICITRSTNNFGPRQHHEKLFPMLIQNALRNRPLMLYGQGTDIRDWLYVKDNCAAIDLVLRHGQLGQIFNIGAHQEKSNNEVTALVQSELGFSDQLIHHVTERPGHDLRYSLDTTRIENQLHWKRQTDFKNGLKETIAWYRKHQR